ncbi:MAG: hypothetical protein Q9O74_11190 [Planctomycetota bacterium]|nr:hypothetical protein [Planctomycetota bacterium]
MSKQVHTPDAFRRVRLILSLAPVLLAGYAHAQTYEINWYTIDAGGEMFTFGGNFELSGTIGQYDAGTLAGGDFELAGGFWPVAQIAPPCVADFNGVTMPPGSAGTPLPRALCEPVPRPTADTPPVARPGRRARGGWSW